MTTAIGGRKRSESAQLRTPTRSCGGTLRRVIGYVIKSPIASVMTTVAPQTSTLFLSSTQKPRSKRTLP